MEKETAVVQAEAKQEPEQKKRNPTTIAIASVITVVIIAASGFAAYVLLTGQRTINTGNASVTTNLIYVTANAPGYLERFNLQSSMYVEAGQVLGWLRGGESFRSPVDGIVVDVNATEGQHIRPMEPIAIIACTANLHIRANLYESDIQDVRLGQPAVVTLDGVRGQSFAGYVRYIGRITAIELAGGAHMIQTGTFRRITHVVPVEIVITDDIDLSLFLGTNARVSIPVLTE